MYVIVIITCEKNRHKATILRETWLSEIGKFPMFRFYFVYGHPELDVDYVVKEEKNELWVKAKDNYEELPMKVKMTFVAIASLFKEDEISGVSGVSGVCKIDDDVYVRLSSLEKSLNSIVEMKIDYAGIVATYISGEYSDSHFGKCEDKVLNKTWCAVPVVSYCSGPLYYLSWKSVQLFLKHRTDVIQIMYEDMSTALFLKDHGVLPTPMLLKTESYREWKNDPSIAGFHNKHKRDFRKIHSSSNEMDRVAIITGITGQDGSYLAEFLLEKNYTVYGIKRRVSTGSNTQRISHLLNNPKFIIMEAELIDPSFYITLFTKISKKNSHPIEFYHLAAISHVKLSFDIPIATAQIDALPTLYILEAIRSLSLENKIRFYQASTSELFGKVQQIPQTELTPFYPRSPYAISKQFAFWMCKNYREAYGIYTVNGILFNHESPRRDENFVTRKITKTVVSISREMNKSDKSDKSDKNDEILYLGNIYAKRDWGHAKDYVRSMWLMMQQDEPDDYVTATGNVHSVKEFVEYAFKEVHIDIEWSGSGIEEVAKNKKDGRILVKIDPQLFRPCEVDYLEGDSSKIKNIGWKTEYSFHDIIKEMINSE